MKRLILVLLLAEALVGALPPPGMTAARTPIPVETVIPAEKNGDLASLLERIGNEYDPAAAGAVGAIRWAEKLLDAWIASGRDSAAARRAAAESVSARGPEGMTERLNRLLWAARQLTSGTNLGLMNEPGGPAQPWSGEDVKMLFAALFEGAGLPFPAE